MGFGTKQTGPLFKLQQILELKYAYIQPSEPLRKYVRDLVVIHFKLDPGKCVPLKPFPAKPQGGISFYIKGHLSARNASGIVEKRQKVQIVGQQEYRQTFQFSHEVLLIDVVFQPGVLYKLLDIPMTELLNKNIDADLVLGQQVHRLNDQLANAISYDAMILIIENFLLEKTRTLDPHLHPIDKIGEFILNNPNTFKLETVANQACLSYRQFERRFAQQVGVSPRFYQRMGRFRKAFELKLNSNHLSWQDIAWQTGYSDYQHLAKDCKQFSGNTPSQLLQEENASPARILGLKLEQYR